MVKVNLPLFSGMCFWDKNLFYSGIWDPGLGFRSFPSLFGVFLPFFGVQDPLDVHHPESAGLGSWCLSHTMECFLWMVSVRRPSSQHGDLWDLIFIGIAGSGWVIHGMFPA